MLMALRMNRSAMAALLAVCVVWMTACAMTAVSSAAEESDAVAVSPGAAAVENAAKADKYLFIFFFDGEDSHTSAMKGVFEAAMAKMTDRADSIAVSVTDAAEKRLVNEFSVRGAPMPMVLAIAPTGAPTRAFPKQFEEAQLQQGFVSPGTAKCMKAIMDRHLLLICVQNGKTQFNQEAMQGVEAFKADPQYAKVAEVVTLNPSDKAERSFLKSLEVDPETTTAVTLLVTPPGAPVATFAGAVTKEEIAAKLAAAQSSCCPGGKCGPGGCGPK